MGSESVHSINDRSTKVSHNLSRRWKQVMREKQKEQEYLAHLKNSTMYTLLTANENIKLWHILSPILFKIARTVSKSGKTGVYIHAFKALLKHCFESFRLLGMHVLNYTYRKNISVIILAGYYGQCECTRNHFPMASIVVSLTKVSKWNSALFKNHKIGCESVRFTRCLFAHFGAHTHSHQCWKL